MNEKAMLKKQMTKKELKKYYSSQRSRVSMGMNTGTRTMKSQKDYRRVKISTRDIPGSSFTSNYYIFVSDRMLLF